MHCVNVDLTRFPSNEHLRWQYTRKLLAYRESTPTIAIILSNATHYYLHISDNNEQATTHEKQSI